MEKGKLIIVSAPSGAGKTTLVKHLLQQIPNIKFSVSCTTRNPRNNEVDGVDYYFISLDEFKQKIENEEFAEWEEVYSGSFYGTLKSEIERIRNSGNHVIFDIDVVGGLNLKKIYPDHSLAIFIQPPSMEELERRLRKRNTETDEVLQTRIEKAKEELQLAPNFDKIIVNNDLEKSSEEIEETVKKFIA